MKVAINGFGRIGRLIFKVCLEKGIKVVAVNDLHGAKSAAYLLRYDSVYGKYNKTVKSGKDYLQVENKKIKVLSEKDPSKLPWKKLKVDAVIESTGKFTDRKGASQHLKAGAKRVIITAPAKGHDITIVPGVNSNKLKKSHKIISVASCTTNALAPVAKVLNDAFGIKKGFMTTVHAYTSTQELVDGTNKKLRRGKAAAINIIPTTTGATTAVCQVLPELQGKLNGLALRVPVVDGSIVDFVVELKKSANRNQINETLKKAASGKMKGIIQYSEEELVSTEIIGNPNSGIIDGLSTQTMGNLAKILIWYDNEYGYAVKVVDVLKSSGR